jgi:hypothetical protein
MKQNKVKLSPREYWLESFSNIPLEKRKEIIAYHDGKPLSWNVAYLEIKYNTPLGRKLLKLRKIGGKV